jgi:hypothetical protein
MLFIARSMTFHGLLHRGCQGVTFEHVTPLLPSLPSIVQIWSSFMLLTLTPIPSSKFGIKSSCYLEYEEILGMISWFQRLALLENNRSFVLRKSHKLWLTMGNSTVRWLFLLECNISHFDSERYSKSWNLTYCPVSLSPSGLSLTSTATICQRYLSDKERFTILPFFALFTIIAIQPTPKALSESQHKPSLLHRASSGTRCTLPDCSKYLGALWVHSLKCAKETRYN